MTEVSWIGAPRSSTRTGASQADSCTAYTIKLMMEGSEEFGNAVLLLRAVMQECSRKFDEEEVEGVGKRLGEIEKVVLQDEEALIVMTWYRSGSTGGSVVLQGHPARTGTALEAILRMEDERRGGEGAVLCVGGGQEH